MPTLLTNGKLDKGLSLDYQYYSCHDISTEKDGEQMYHKFYNLFSRGSATSPPRLVPPLEVLHFYLKQEGVTGST